MNQKTKQCQNCKNYFLIAPEDFEFYAKIKVPPPTWCPQCLLIRKLIWSNQRTFYKRKCDAPAHNEEIFSLYSPDKPLKVYDQKYWWSDEWDPIAFGKDYDFNKSFFQQFKELFQDVPTIALENEIPETLINSNYCNDSWEIKNCYLCFTASSSENCLYSNIVLQTKDTADSTWIIKSELCYQCLDCYNSHRVFYGQNIDQCFNSYFLFNCTNCLNCFGCVNLKNKQYYIFNKPYSKEEYKKKLEEFDFGSHKTILKINEQFLKFKLDFPHKYTLLINCHNVLGNNVKNSNNCFNCFDIEGGVENSKYIVCAGSGLKDSYHVFNAGTNSELFYDSIIVGTNSNNIKFSNGIWYNCFNISYSKWCRNSSYLFGCIGLRKNQYCILNKQYTKEEYEKLIPQIINHMDKMPYVDSHGEIYKYGEFFPPELSPFAYNETIAQEYFPLFAEAAEKAGYSWKNREEKNIQITIEASQLPDDIKDVPNSIINEIIGCEHKNIDCNEQCTRAFRIIPHELEFYRKMNLSLPRFCPNCRYYQRIKLRNPLKLWKRKCQCAGVKSGNNIYQNIGKHSHGNEHCLNEFETTYSPNRQEIIYCEKCYNEEVS